MTLVDHEGLASRRRTPVDRADAVTRYEVSDVRVLDTVALDASDFAASERLRLHGREDPAERDRARIRLQLMPAADSLFPDDEPEWVARPNFDIAERIDAPARAAKCEWDLPLRSCPEPYDVGVGGVSNFDASR